ncbi:MAG: DUF885 domain-containing protein [Gammaproteobacteria bacterium]|nr:DUF885 domain-containing protein [Gammaproteobacteria bacterium]
MKYLRFVLLGILLSPSAWAGGADELGKLADDYWQWQLREFPESATWLGDNRYNDRLTDLAPAAIERRKSDMRVFRDRAAAIDAAGLAGQDALSLELLNYELGLAVDGQKFPSEYLAIEQLDGPQLAFPQLLGVMPVRTVRDYENYIARLNAFPDYLGQVQVLLEKGIKTGWTQPAGPLRSIPQQIEEQLSGDPVKSTLYAPFTKFPDAIASADRERLGNSARKAIAEAVFTALKKLHDFARDTYLPAGRQQIAAASLPDGKAYYDYQIRDYTTTALGADRIHEIGLAEIKRIRAEMEKVVADSGYKGSFDEFLAYLRTDPRFYYTQPEDLLIGYRDIAKRADEQLPTLFAELPRLPYGVRAFPDYEAPSQTTARYYPGAEDGARAGVFMANLYKLDSRPKYEMEALTLHEAVPGHHLQIARAQELKGLPAFRRNAGYTAYVEGWGLYAESLGAEMGFYADPYSRFGQLTYEMWRACRLVVDTGMHAKGWSRQQAIDFMKDNTAKTELDIVVEIDRYIVWPGQALAYKLGELKIKELRARARQALGGKFDLRRFHNAVLDNGPLPLEVLEREIDRWIAGQR